MPTDTNQKFKLSDHISNAEGSPLLGLIVRAYLQDAQGVGSLLGETVIDKVTNAQG